MSVPSFFHQKKKKKTKKLPYGYLLDGIYVIISPFICVCVRDRMIIIIKDMNKQPFYPGSQGKKKYHTITPKTEKENSKKTHIGINTQVALREPSERNW